MGGMRIDPGGLLLPMKEQVAEKIVAALPVAPPVAGGKKTVKVLVKRLRFPTQKAKERYLALRDAAREGVISWPEVEYGDGGKVRKIEYTILWAGEFTPTGVNSLDLWLWRQKGRACVIEEYTCGEGWITSSK